MAERFLREFRCPACDHATFKDFAQTVATLRAAGMLRRVEHPDETLVGELLSASANRLRCSECGAAGLQVSEAHDEFDWPEAKECERCGAEIPAERLEIFPDTTLCVKCQSAGESGVQSDAPEFCPRCGGLMQLRPAGGSGLARYVMKCSDCGMST